MKPYLHLRHRQPFAMLDLAEIPEEGGRARGAKLLTAGDPALGPDGTLPFTYVIEAMAQTSGLASGRRGGSMLAALRDIRFGRAAAAGDRLEVESILERVMGGLFLFRCTARSAGETIAEGGIVLHFHEGP